MDAGRKNPAGKNTDAATKADGTKNTDAENVEVFLHKLTHGTGPYTPSGSLMSQTKDTGFADACSRLPGEHMNKFMEEKL